MSRSYGLMGPEVPEKSQGIPTADGCLSALYSTGASNDLASSAAILVRDELENAGVAPRQWWTEVGEDVLEAVFAFARDSVSGDAWPGGVYLGLGPGSRLGPVRAGRRWPG
ncbi:hypothetical protein DKT74_03705 [Streptomyces sp. ZEA17I]|nr:hypothetical protein DKT74_03705 [Streptomyces sp. ZEA17I]